MVRRAGPAELEAVVRLALALWPENEAGELQEEFSGLLFSPEAALFLAESGGAPVGFAQCQIRHDYVEGTCGGPIGYLEGVYVQPGCRRRGVASALVGACERWAAGQGCREFASDCELENTQSLAFHLGAGFQEANRIICFVKELPAPAEGSPKGEEEETT